MGGRSLTGRSGGFGRAVESNEPELGLANTSTSIEQFIMWWDAQCGVEENMDPYQLALAQLAKSNMISPNGGFSRGR